MGNWYSTGYNAQSQERDVLSYTPDRIWIPVGQAKDIVFIDTAMFSFDEHNYFHDGSWRNWLTCLAPVTDEGEPECCKALGKDTRYRVTMFTVVDTSKWTDKKGNTRQYEVKVLPTKFNASKKLAMKEEDLQKEGKSLVGGLYRVTRYTSKSPSSGDDFERQRDADMAKLFSVANYKGQKLADLYEKAENDSAFYARLSRVFALSKGTDGRIERRIFPFRYENVFAPKAASDVREALSGYKRDAGEDKAHDRQSKYETDEVPF
jgi:hypothetical protein